MAITSVGYDGTVTEAQWADMISKVGVTDYGVVGPGDWKVTAVSGADRTISIATGKGWGRGVYDTSDANVTIQLDTVSSGSRWDLVSARRDWTGAGGLTVFTKVNGNATKAIPSGRLNGPGTLDDQPLALVQVTAGQTQPTAIVDLRCWGSNGGMSAVDDLALTYLGSLGAQVRINNALWFCTLDGGGNPVWSRSSGLGAVPVFGAGASLAGGIPAAGTDFLIQAGTQIYDTNSTGYGRITFPKPFPGGLLSVVLIDGDSSIDLQQGHPLHYAVAGGAYGTGRVNDVVYSISYPAGSNAAYTGAGTVRHRVNWIAIGW